MQTFHLNRSWHHQSIIWWHPDDVRDFGWWHLCQYWNGIKGSCMRGWGFQEFLHPSWNHVCSSLLCHGHAPLGDWTSVFIDLICMSDCQVNVQSYKSESPTTRTTYLVSADGDQWIPIREYQISLCILTVLWLTWVGSKRAGRSKLKFNCLYLDDLYRCKGLELSLKLTGALYSYPALRCCHGKHLLGMLILSKGIVSMTSKDKPVGGVSTGPTRHGLLGLAHKCY